MKTDPFAAHIRDNSDCTQAVQSVSIHCRDTAAYAAGVAKNAGLESAAYLAGLLHDMGKYTKAFQTYLEKAARGEKVLRGSVNHTFAGVRYIIENFTLNVEGSPVDQFSTLLTRDILAYAVGSHHGAFDCMDENGRNGFEYRRTKEGIGYEEACSNFLAFCADKEELDNLHRKAVYEIRMQISRLQKLTADLPAHKKKKAFLFMIGLLARLVQSAVIEGDRKDTAEYMSGSLQGPSKPFQGNAPEKLRAMWERELTFAEGKIHGFNTSSAINKARQHISDICRARAEDHENLYQLNVPTGSGKTLSSLRFALAHAAKWKKQRIFFVSPLLSILEQNAKVIHQYIEDQNLILEHHSNAVQPQDNGEELNYNELRLASWESPIIITTLVQMLNTFFAGQTANIRRFHSLCDAVVVIDEVQSVPTNLLTMFNLMIIFLSGVCGTTVVLCSATQPNWSKADYPLPKKPTNMFPYDESIWEVFRRTRIQNGGSCSTELLPGKIQSLRGEARSVLVVCNKKSESEFLYHYFAGVPDFQCFHLSASMCMEHRRKELWKLRSALEDQREWGQRIICISTQVVEAGVDISFECVIRLMAGLDNAVQAAGRCNRNGESQNSENVYILNCTDENLTMLSEIQRDKTACMAVLANYRTTPEKYKNDLSSNEAIQDYFQYLYDSMEKGYQDDPVSGKHYSVFDLLSDNSDMRTTGDTAGVQTLYIMGQAFKAAAGAFHVFDQSSIDVIVPYENGKNIIAALCSEEASFDFTYCQRLIKEASGYTVTIYPYQKQKLIKEQALLQVPDLDLWYLKEEYYDENTGVTMQQGEISFLEV